MLGNVLLFTIQKVLIAKFDFGSEKLPDFSRNGHHVSANKLGVREKTDKNQGCHEHYVSVLRRRLTYKGDC